MLALQTGSAEKLVLVFQSRGFARNMAESIERQCHSFLDGCNISGEWFAVGHDMSRDVIESAIDLISGEHCENDLPSLAEQTKFQIEMAISS